MGPRNATLLLALGCLVVPATAQAGAVFYTDEAAFTAAAGAVHSLDTSAANVALADEVASPPAQDGALGPRLSFRPASTGLCATFALETLEPGAGFTFDDGEPSPALFPPDTLSIGDINDFEDDDFRLHFPSGQVFAAGFFLVGDASDPGQRLTAHGVSGLIVALEGGAIPASTGGGSQFVGIVATEPLTSIRFDEDAAGDDVAIRDVRLACATEDPDADGLANLPEHRAGTDPNDPDSDDDGLLDGEEVGTGSFGTRRRIAFYGNKFVHQVLAADLDGDGDADVVLATRDWWSGDDELRWYRNAGDGTFSVGGGVFHDEIASPRSLSATDLDGDGDLDVLSTRTQASSSVWSLVWYENTDGAGSLVTREVPLTAGYKARSVFAADLDGDGDPDPVVSQYSTSGASVVWYANDGLGGFGPEQLIAGAASAPWDVSAADLDGDGDVDVVTAGADGIAWHENTDGAGSFVSVQSIGSATAFSIHATDLDRDGDPDLLFRTSSAVVGYSNLDGAGSFGFLDSIPGSAAMAPADVDGDGDPDLLRSDRSTDTLAWFEGGNGGFGPSTVIADALEADSSLFGADLDGDGDLDVISAGNFDQDAIDELDGELAWFEQLELADPLDPDSDDDGLLDGFEVVNGFDPRVAGEESGDPDGDGLDNLGEQAAGSDPHDADTDEDGVDDGTEVAAGSDPTDPLSVPPQVPGLGPWGLVGLAALVATLGRRVPRPRAGRARRA